MSRDRRSIRVTWPSLLLPHSSPLALPNSPPLGPRLHYPYKPCCDFPAQLKRRLLWAKRLKQKRLTVRHNTLGHTTQHTAQCTTHAGKKTKRSSLLHSTHSYTLHTTQHHTTHTQPPPQVLSHAPTSGSAKKTRHCRRRSLRQNVSAHRLRQGHLPGGVRAHRV